MNTMFHNSKRVILWLLTFMLTTTIYAQNFTAATGTPFIGVTEGSIAFADIDGDNDQDVLICGMSRSSRASILYTNNGAGVFSMVAGTPFASVDKASIAFADIDGDNDQDVLISGRGNMGYISKLYTNNGSGSFTEVIGTPFVAVTQSSIAFADVDGDNDQDVIITGQNSSFSQIAKLYTNDGKGVFTEETGTPFTGVKEGAIAFADVDGDSDQDLIITGSATSGEVSNLYINNGSGNFSLKTNTPIDSISASAVAFADIDGDNDQDLIISGATLNSRLTKMYTNNGSGVFTEVLGTPFDQLAFSSISFADIDGDNDQDVFISGSTLFMAHSKLYTNNGSGTFRELQGTTFDGVVYGSTAFSDVDGDGDHDLLITGTEPSVNFISKLYTNGGIVSSTRDLSPEARLDFTPFPNPVISNKLHIRFKSTELEKVMIRVYDLKGRLRSHQEVRSSLGQQTLEVDITDLSPGNYFIQLECGQSIGVAKFQVQ